MDVRLKRSHWNLLPLAIAVCGWCATLVLCRTILSLESTQMAQTAALATRNIQSKVTSSISARIAPLEALVARWGADADPWQPEWESEAQQLHERYPALESINWLDASGSLQWSVPSVELRPELLRPNMQRAQATGKTTVVLTSEMSDSGNTLLVFIPIFRHGSFGGCVVATLQTGQWLHSVIDAEVPQGYAASISHGNEQIYLRDGGTAARVPRYLSEANVNLYGMPWVVRVWPTPDEWAGSRQILLALSLLIGLLLYVAGALAVAAHRRARMVEWARQKMTAQQEDLHQANQRLEAVIQASPLAIVAMDTSGLVKSWNSAAERIFGWSAEEVMDRLPPFIGEAQLEEFQAKIARASGGELIAGLERRRLRKDGTSIDVSIWTAPLRDAAGSICGIIMAVADVSEKKKLEEQLRHSQKMEAVGRLAGGVAHDFNNLLTVINGYGHMMLDSVNSSDRMHGHAEQIVKAGNQAAALTSQLLAFSRRQVIQPKSIELNQIVTNLEKMLRRVMGEDIRLHTSLAAGLNRVKADPNQIEQVLINLVANARDAMPYGGLLTITTRNVELNRALVCEGAEIPAGSYVELAVADTGQGMDAETRSHLFEPFFTTKERGKGTGLGLSSVYGSVRQNGGGITVSSTQGAGTIFRIYLPQLRGAVLEPHAEPAPHRIRRGSETILLVEDEAPVRHMIRDVLANAGYRVLEATDGADALHKWERESASIDLLLTDVVMPVLNGRELAKRFSSHAPQLEVIYMSGYADDVVAHHGTLEPGMNLLQKPFLPAALAVKVREVLDARKPRTDPVSPIYQRATM